LGLRDVIDLVAVLDSSLAKKDAGNSLLLSAYAEKRRADVLAVGCFTESMLVSFGNDLDVTRLMRGQVLGLMQTCKPLKDELLQHAAGLTHLRKSSKTQMSQSEKSL